MIILVFLNLVTVKLKELGYVGTLVVLVTRDKHREGEVLIICVEVCFLILYDDCGLFCCCVFRL